MYQFRFQILAHVLLHFIDIDSEFKQFLYELVPILLSPENLVVKKINGITMTGKGLLHCFQVISDFNCIKIFSVDSFIVMN